MKNCPNCEKEFPSTTEFFYKNKASKTGLGSYCKKCVKETNKTNHDRYYKENKAKVNAKNLENYYKKNPKVIKEAVPDGMKKCCVCLEFLPLTSENFGKLSSAKDGYKYSCKKCRREKEYVYNKEYSLAKQKEWYENNKEKAAVYGKRYKDKNREWYREYDKKYYKENMVTIKATVKKNFYRRMEEDVSYKLLQRYRKRLWAAVKGHGKAAGTLELVGCSKEELSKHLESQFATGMTWDNYGKWHVDHIVPCSSYDFSQEQQQIECFHYSNLQPLWAEDNYRKSNKII